MKNCKLGEIINVFDYLRKPISGFQRIANKGKYPYYGANGIIDYVNEPIFHGEYILFAEDGTVCTNEYKPIIFLTKHNDQFWVNNHAHIFKAIDKICSNRYLYYNLSNKNIKHIITGAVQMKINQENLRSLDIAIHDKQKQQHIVNILGTIDDKIENNEKIYRKIEQELQLIYSKYLSKNNIDKNDYNYIPLTDISEFIGGYSYKGNELIKSKYGMITIKNFDRNGDFKLDGFKDLSENNSAKSAQYVDLYDIVVAHTDLTQNAEIIGNAEIILNKKHYEKLIASMDLVIVRPKEINNNLLYLLLHNQDFKKHALGYCAGTTVLHLNKKALQEYRVYIPKEKKLLERISNTISLLISKQSQLIIKNQRLTELKQLYLKKFFD